MADLQLGKVVKRFGHTEVIYGVDLGEGRALPATLAPARPA